MKFDRTVNKTGKGKYALVLLRKVKGTPRSRPALAEAIKQDPSVLDFGLMGSSSEFMVIRLKDKYAEAAFRAYANAARDDDHLEWANEMFKLAERARNHPGRKRPD